MVFAYLCILSYLSLSLIFAFVLWEFWLWSHLWSHGCAKSSTTNLAIRCAQITGWAQIEKCSWHRLVIDCCFMALLKSITFDNYKSKRVSRLIVWFSFWVVALFELLLASWVSKNAKLGCRIRRYGWAVLKDRLVRHHWTSTLLQLMQSSTFGSKRWALWQIRQERCEEIRDSRLAVSS